MAIAHVEEDAGMRHTNENGANVVPLWMHQAKMDESPLNDMRSYWDELCAGRILPLRSEVDPRAIASSLENGFILERIQPGSVRFRLAGTQLSDLMGMEVRGMPIRSFIELKSRKAFSTSIERVFDGPEIQEYRLVSNQRNAPGMTARLLILPLRSDEGTINRALGCLVADGIVGMTPRVFQVAETRITNLVTGETSRNIELQNNAGFAERPAQFSPKLQLNPDGQPKLRLVKSDTWDSGSAET